MLADSECWGEPKRKVRTPGTGGSRRHKRPGSEKREGNGERGGPQRLLLTRMGRFAMKKLPDMVFSEIGLEEVVGGNTQGGVLAFDQDDGVEN